MTKPWRRREWTTRGADPTLVIEWKFILGRSEGSINEFQNVYRGTGFLEGLDEAFLAWLHGALEEAWWDDLINQVGNDGPADRRPY